MNYSPEWFNDGYPDGIAPLAHLVKLLENESMIPQQVTSRYVRNLLVKGRNNEFILMDILRMHHEVDSVIIGHYFDATVKSNENQKRTATGVTPEQAVERCLAKHGVTFR